MDKVVSLLLALTLTLIFFSIIYYIPFFSKKKIRHGKFDLLQFINIFFSPLFILPIFYFLREMISANPGDVVIRIPKYVSEIGFMMILYIMILGHGIHSVSVILSKNMKDLRKHKIWEINEFFHNAFSHLLITISAILILLSYIVMETNHPSPEPLSTFEIAILITSGIITGIILGMASIEGSIPNIMFAILYIASLVVPLIFVLTNLDFKNFPFTTFGETMLLVSVMTIAFYGYKRKGYPEIVPHYFFDDK